jgi:hypothetical protein
MKFSVNENNVWFDFNTGKTLSISISPYSYGKIKFNENHIKIVQDAEIAILSNDGFITQEFCERYLGYNPHDDVLPHMEWGDIIEIVNILLKEEQDNKQSDSMDSAML